MTILLTGGCGFIGSHMAWAMHNAGERTVVLDDLSTGTPDGMPPPMQQVIGDMADTRLTSRLLDEHGITEIVHLAARRRIIDSLADPLDCYRTNVTAMLALLDAAVRGGVRRFVFASTAAIYGVPSAPIISEDAPGTPLNPYGWSKLIGERLLIDTSSAHGLRHAILRFFNVAGADQLIRAAAETALGRRPALDIFGADWPTPDGTCVRDFIHVSDLVDIHLVALRYLRAGGENLVLNCGSGKGTSVREVASAVERATGRPLPVRVGPRRPGETAVAIADTTRLTRTLGWRPRFESIDIMVEQALRMEAARPAPGESGKKRPDDAAVEAFAEANIDRDAYRAAYPDVAAAGVDPLEHWLAHGWREGRMLAPGLEIRRDAEARSAPGSGWVHFIRRGVDIAIRTQRDPDDQPSQPATGREGDPTEDLDAFAARALDRQSYLKAYPDVAAAGVDPVQHWLRHGLREGRLLAPDLVVRRGAAARAARGAAWQHFMWNGEQVAICRREDDPARQIASQIMAQARHEPAVLAAGALALTNLRRFSATDLLARDGIDWRGLLAAIGGPPDVVIAVPWLVIGGADKYGADFADAVMASGGGPVLVLVTDQTAMDAKGWEDISLLAPYRRARVVFLREYFSGTQVDPRMLARLLHALRPRGLLVINSRCCLEAVAQFGRGLSQTTRILCAYFSMGVDGLAAPHGTRFPRRTMPHAVALTDNSPMAERLTALHAAVPGRGISILPTRVATAPEDVFTARLSARRRRLMSGGHSRRWLWVSRIEPWKGTEILAALARRRPGDRFDLYGPIEGSLAALGLTLPNIVHHGTLQDVPTADFSGQDGFVFTSLFEGMPNVVLEMSQHAIPMVLAEVGGLRDALDDRAAWFVRHAANTEDTAAAFDAALESLLAAPSEAVLRKVRLACDQVVARHSPETFARNVATLMGDA